MKLEKAVYAVDVGFWMNCFEYIAVIGRSRLVSRAQVALVVLVLLALVPLVASDRPAQARPEQTPANTDRSKDELLVTYRGSDTQLENESGGQVEEKIPALNTRLVSFPEIKGKPSVEAGDILELKKAVLSREPGVISVDYNHIRKVAATNDTHYAQLWGLQKIDAEAAWEAGTTGAGTPVAVVDTGVDSDHPDLSGSVAYQRDFVAGDAIAEDANGHGTHVAGIVAARANNGEGVAGVCPGCSLIAAKALDATGSGTDADIAEAIIYSADRGAKVINLSMSGPGYSSVLHSAVKYAAAKGVLVVAAAGNSSTDEPFYPAAYDEAIAVSATTPGDQLAPFSNFGPHIELAAPGTDIISTYPGGGYVNMSGTSMAAPHVAGAAALLFARGLSKSQIREDLHASAADLGPAGQDPGFGYGQLDAYGAVALAAQGTPGGGVTGTADTRAPSIKRLRPVPGDTTRDHTPRIRAVVKDNTINLQKVNIKLYVARKRIKKFSYSASTDRLTYTSPRLTKGKKVVKIVARDAAGNVGARSWYFTIR